MKKYLLGLFAVALAVGFSAFRTTTQVKYIYAGPSTLVSLASNLQDPSNWYEEGTQTPTFAATCELGSEVTCSFETSTNQSEANTTHLRDDMAIVLGSSSQEFIVQSVKIDGSGSDLKENDKIADR